ncbi:hypothetical protein AAF712_014268 [Marasmius tenuissimus]|uniref:AB hydrolase-1 domain-containing protein n=1 Tax=Marasmius tenuissimus TaxID=585030 RepID=A0ABR2ZCN8_9AGAR
MYRKSTSKGLLLIGVFLLHGTVASANYGLSSRQENGTEGWTESSWSTLQPSKDLQWVPCYIEQGDFQCTRLEVPLDYNHPEGDKAAIAIVRLLANVSNDSQEYRGPILFNPGGPGESGVDYVLAAGSTHRVGLGPQFDLVGFDPRGVRRSTPQSFWANSQIMGTLAYERGKDYLGHMNTANSARDMLSIVEAHGQEKLQYWGLSYGSVLGYTFAAMFPNKVGRLIIDGVVEIEDYYRARLLNLAEDADKTLQWFFQSCKDAGPQSCAFYEDSTEAMNAKLQKTYNHLNEDPIPVRTNESYGVVDYDATVTYYCNDGDAVPPGTDAARDHYKEAIQLYGSWGTFRASHRIACSGWSSEIPKTQFRGPISGNPSFPMLIIGNTADPATPLSA